MMGFNGTAFPLRLHSVLVLFVLALLALVAGLLYVQWIERDFYLKEGDKRSLRYQKMLAPRGMIVDRNGMPLAVSTPLITLQAGKNLWADPQALKKIQRTRLIKLADRLCYWPDKFVERIEAEGARARWGELAIALGQAPEALRHRLEQVSKRGAYNLQSDLPPEQAEAILALRIDDITPVKHYRRYYPSAELTAQLVGFINTDGLGQEGLELAFDQWLSSNVGKRRVIQDVNHRWLDESTAEPLQSGKDLPALSIDLRLQSLASQALQQGLQRSKAKAGSLVLLDVQTGEILALVNQPTFNPNNRASYAPGFARNRALLDNLQPGSTAKPLAMLAALQTGRWQPGDTVDLGNRKLMVKGRRKPIEDVSVGGPRQPNLTQILIESSNVGISKIALDIGPEPIREVMQRLGLGQVTGLDFPGEQSGMLPERSRWDENQITNLAYGYGLEVTAVQLAHAYATIANDGLMKPLSLFRLDEIPQGEQVIDKNIAKTVRGMLQQVVHNARVPSLAKVPGYRVAGKSGTTEESKGAPHRALFAGFAPAAAPRFALVVVLDAPQKLKEDNKAHFGGRVAAPIFSQVMAGALQLMQVPADEPAAILAGGMR